MDSYYITPAEYTEAEGNRINRNLLEKRIRLLGWDKQKAITTPVRRWERIPGDLIEQAYRNGVSYQALRKRISRGEVNECIM